MSGGNDKTKNTAIVWVVIVVISIFTGLPLFLPLVVYAYFGKGVNKLIETVGNKDNHFDYTQELISEYGTKLVETPEVNNDSIQNGLSKHYTEEQIRKVEENKKYWVKKAELSVDKSVETKVKTKQSIVSLLNEIKEEKEGKKEQTIIKEVGTQSKRRGLAFDSNSVANGVIMAEILGKPKSMRY